jgi:NADP-dependent 3-hydroxy acid dehydrogenase YdfG
LSPGASSGIGLAATELFSKHGAYVVAVDLNPPSKHIPNATFHKVDVTKWDEQYNLFASTAEKYGRIDIAFLNAGVGEIEDVFVDKFDDKGRLQEPAHKVLAVNLIAPINGFKIAVHFMKKGNEPGSIVITGSGKCKLSSRTFLSHRHSLLTVARFQWCWRHTYVCSGQAWCQYTVDSFQDSADADYSSFWVWYEHYDMISLKSTISD